MTGSRDTPSNEIDAEQGYIFLVIVLIADCRFRRVCFRDLNSNPSTQTLAIHGDKSQAQKVDRYDDSLQLVKHGKILQVRLPFRLSNSSRGLCRTTFKLQHACLGLYASQQGKSCL